MTFRSSDTNPSPLRHVQIVDDSIVANEENGHGLSAKKNPTEVRKSGRDSERKKKIEGGHGVYLCLAEPGRRLRELAENQLLATVKGLDPDVLEENLQNNEQRSIRFREFKGPRLCIQSTGR